MHALDPEIQLRMHLKLIILILKQNNLSTNMLPNVLFIIVKTEYNLNDKT